MQNKIKHNSTCGKFERSDCLVSIEPYDTLKIEINSKVKKLFGKEIEKTIRKVIKENNIEKIFIKIDDYGALDWVIRARLECALQRASV